MKNTTPMKILKDTFEDLHQIIGAPVELNKSAPKTHYGRNWETTTTKGVESDFIRIYKTNSDNKSFSFSFDNLDGKKGTITVVFKEVLKDTDKFTSNTFNFDNFKTRLKTFIQTLKILQNTKSLNTESMKETVFAVFDLKSGIKARNEILKEAVVSIKEEVKPFRKKMLSANRKYIKTVEDVDILQRTFQNERKIISKELGITELELELAKKKKILDTKTKKIHLELIKKHREVSTLTYNLRNTQNIYKQKIETLSTKYPKNITTQIIEQLTK